MKVFHIFKKYLIFSLPKPESFKGNLNINLFIDYIHVVI